MPIYCYRVHPEKPGCPLCHETFEVKQAMADPRLSSCPECGSEVQCIITEVSWVHGHNMGDGLTRSRLKHSGLRKMVKGDDGRYIDDTPK